MNRRRRIPREIFLSHAGRDRRFADRLAQDLRQRGLSVWYSRTHIAGAAQWHDEIGAALQRCDWFLIILSPHAVKSRWVKRELLYALQEERYHNHIVPLLRTPCDVKALSWTLPAIQFVDFTGDFAWSVEALVQTWMGKRARS